MGMEAPAAAYRSMAAAADEGAHGGVPRAVRRRRRGGGAAVQRLRRCQLCQLPRPRRRGRRGGGGGGRGRGGAGGGRRRRLEARGVEMLRRREYDYGCACIDKALRLGIEAAADDESRAAESSTRSRARGTSTATHSSAEHKRWSPSLPRTAAATLPHRYRARGPAAAEPHGPHGDVAALGVADAGEWRASGSAAIGRRVRRFFACTARATARWSAGRPSRTRATRARGAASTTATRRTWTATNSTTRSRRRPRGARSSRRWSCCWRRHGRRLASVALYAKQPERAAERADAHGRLADAALQNDQPERAADEYAAARAVLDDEVKAGRLTNDDRAARRRRVLDGRRRAPPRRRRRRAAPHARASATRLRSANLQRRALDAQIGSSRSGSPAAPPRARRPPRPSTRRPTRPRWRRSPSSSPRSTRAWSRLMLRINRSKKPTVFVRTILPRRRGRLRSSQRGLETT